MKRIGSRYAALVVGGFTAAAMVGCQAPEKPEAGFVFFPAPPNPPRVQFLMWASGADQVEPQRDSLERFVLGEEVGVARAISKPYGLAARDGVVYVCDTKGLSLCRLDFKNQTYTAMGSRGPGQLKKPINMVIDQLGYKFVVDPVRQEVVVFDPADKYIRAFAIPEPCHPVDVALYENELYVLDNDETPQIVVLDRTTGEVKRSFGSMGGEPGQFKIPGSLAISPDGYLYVSDTHNWRIQKLTLEGKPVWMKGTPGYTLGQFGRPRGVRVAPDGIVYVVDGATELVQMYDGDGNVLMRFAGPGNMPGALGLPSTLTIDKTSLPYFQRYLHKDFRAEYLVIVASQYGTRLINVYAFGAFPDGYQLNKSEVAAIPVIPMEEGVGPVEGDTVPTLQDDPHSKPAEKDED